MIRIIATLIALFAAPALAQEVEQTPLEHPLFSAQEGDKILGDANAPVTIVEYSSLSCPHCASFHANILPELKTKYIDTGKVNLVARPFPLNAPALTASKLVACVDDPIRHHKFLEVFFKLQEKWAFSGDYAAKLKQIAQVGGMSAEQFDACTADETLESDILLARKQAAEELIVRSTPTFFVNGEKLVGSSSVELFGEAIERALGE